MPQPLFRDGEHIGTASSSANPTVTLPTYQAGDLVLIGAADDGGTGPWSAPAGWDPVDASRTDQGFIMRHWYRVMDGSEGATVQLTNPSAASKVWAAVSLDPNGGSGWTISDYEYSTAANGEGVSGTLAGLVDSLLIISGGNDGSDQPDGVPSGMTLAASAASGGSVAIAMFYELLNANADVSRTVPWDFATDGVQTYGFVFTVGAGSGGDEFQAAWARGSNVVIQGGMAA